MTELKYINKEENKNLQINDLITLGLYTILLIIVMGAGVGIGTLLTTEVYVAKYTLPPKITEVKKIGRAHV